MRSAHALTHAPPAIRHGAPAVLLTAVRARVRAGSLDRRLAAGAPPWESPVLAARALQITNERSRRNLARTLERLAERAERSAPGSLSAVVPVCRSEVRAALPQIMSVAARLRDDAPVDARGIARLVALLSDGAGPLYVTGRPGALGSLLDDVSRDLDVTD
jgi:hypothetical protein